MSILSTIVLSLSMSADAFAVSLGKGACFQKPRLIDAVKTGAIFGGVESCAPILGWLLGSLASGFVETVDHWIAFAILGLVGGKMIFEALRNEKDGAEESCPTTPHPLLLAVTAVGTSIDSMAVGVSLAFVGSNILISAIAIGIATFTMSTLGIMLGHVIGTRFGRWAEALGGVGLILIGIKILLKHTGG